MNRLVSMSKAMLSYRARFGHPLAVLYRNPQGRLSRATGIVGKSGREYVRGMLLSEVTQPATSARTVHTAE